MTAISTPVVGQTPGRREQQATRLMFFCSGFAAAAWAALVPTAKLNTSASEGQLGLLLLCIGIGALGSMPLTGLLTSRFGCRRVLVLAVLLFGLTLPLLALTTTLWLLALVLVLFGVGLGITDCAMNIQAVVVEKAAGRPLMSGFHGFYSVGGIAGAGCLALLMSLGVPAALATTLASLLILLLLGLSVAGLLSERSNGQSAAWVLPRGVVLWIGLICFAMFLAEGTVLDWSAVFLADYRGMSAQSAGVGFVCFALTMTVCRLTGDATVARLGSRLVVLGGAVLAASGLLLSLLTTHWGFSLLGYALLGLGCANIVPVMFSAIGRQHSMPEAVAVPVVATLGYIGVLAGPALIGAVAALSSLPLALGLIVLLLLWVALVASKVGLSQSARPV